MEVILMLQWAKQDSEIYLAEAANGGVLQEKVFNFIKKKTLAQVFSCESWEISKNTFFTEHLWATASTNFRHPQKYATWTKRCTEIHSDLQNPALWIIWIFQEETLMFFTVIKTTWLTVKYKNLKIFGSSWHSGAKHALLQSSKYAVFDHTLRFRLHLLG